MSDSYYYKYLSYNEGSLCVLEPGTLLFKNPNTFNDPFDCKPYFDEEAASNITKHRPDLFKEFASRQGLTPAERIEKKGKINAQFKRHVISGEYWESMSSHYGVFCFSRNALNILMWSHYADEHRGFVVEFEWGTPSDNLIPFEVQYQDKRPSVNPCTHFQEGDTQAFKDLLLTKSTLWSYEAEERLIDWRRQTGVHPYNKRKILKSVILGIRMDQEHKDHISEIIKNINCKEGTNIGVYQAEENKSEFSLTVKGHPRDLLAVDPPNRKPRYL